MNITKIGKKMNLEKSIEIKIELWQSALFVWFRSKLKKKKKNSCNVFLFFFKSQI